MNEVPIENTIKPRVKWPISLECIPFQLRIIILFEVFNKKKRQTKSETEQFRSNQKRLERSNFCKIALNSECISIELNFEWGWITVWVMKTQKMQNIVGFQESSNRNCFSLCKHTLTRALNALISGCEVASRVRLHISNARLVWQFVQFSHFGSWFPSKSMFWNVSISNRTISAWIDAIHIRLKWAMNLIANQVSYSVY